MTDYTEGKGNILRNLKDAGCDDKIIGKYLQLEELGKVKEQLYLLSQQKSSLLEALHESQKKIDCLDFLVFQIKKEYETKKSVG